MAPPPLGRPVCSVGGEPGAICAVGILPTRQSVMRAMVLKNPGPIDSSPLRAMELPDPISDEHEARIKVHCRAVCRADLHVIASELQPMNMPVIPGHQAGG